MRIFRSVRTFSAAVAIVTALVVLCLAAQDLWGYHRAIAQRWTTWAVSGQALWQLAGGVGKLVATVSLLIVGGGLLGRTLTRPAPAVERSHDV